SQSWRFMSAYRRGLTERAPAWAVRKQKQHWQVSQRAILTQSTLHSRLAMWCCLSFVVAL
ncbi:hypothetical protein BYT27DRAFT_7286719, partial [Phlegmacium glaucopus]